MEITLEHTLDAVSETDWNALADRSVTATVFQTYRWQRAWAESFSAGLELWIVTARSQGRLTGVAPLVMTKKGSLRILKFIGQGHADYCDFLCSPECSDVGLSLLRFLKSREGEWDAMALDYVPDDSVTARTLARLGGPEGLYVQPYARHSCSYIHVEPDGEQLRALMAKKNLQRDFKHLQKQGKYEAVHYTRPEDIEPILETFFDQHIRRRKGLTAPSLFNRTENKAFYRALVNNVAPTGALLMTVVSVDQKPVAFHLGWVYKGTLTYYKPSYDPQWAKHSPGDALLLESFGYALNRGLSAFDFGLGNETYKSCYANDSKAIVSFKVFQSPGAAQLSRVVDTVKGWIRR